MKMGIIVLSLTMAGVCSPAIHTITNSGTAFTPNTLTITLGDTVTFVLASIHNAQEVSEAAWNANQSASNGGFQTPLGGGTVILRSSGTYYYVCVPHASFGMKGTITVNQTTDVQPAGGGIPAISSLEQNYPNPFNPVTVIPYRTSGDGAVRLTVFNLLGSEVATLAEGAMEPGRHTARWDAAALPTGIYFFRLTSGKRTETKRMSLVR